MEPEPLIIPRSQGPTIRQVFYEEEKHIIFPDTSLGITIINGAVPFPIVDVLEEIGPFEMKAFHDYKNPAGLIETFQNEINKQATTNPRINQMNGILITDTDRIGVHQNFRGSKVSRELETATYNLLQYIPTKKVTFRSLDLGELPRE
jgi:hypothetical protein|tara:strand:- start:102 stop:545 length:444 start_codon:yes stop_codon:yes gene_type:complete